MDENTNDMDVPEYEDEPYVSDGMDMEGGVDNRNIRKRRGVVGGQTSNYDSQDNMGAEPLSSENTEEYGSVDWTPDEDNV